MFIVLPAELPKSGIGVGKPIVTSAGRGLPAWGREFCTHHSLFRSGSGLSKLGLPRESWEQWDYISTKPISVVITKVAPYYFSSSE